MTIYDVAKDMAARVCEWEVQIDPCVKPGIILYCPVEFEGRAPGVYVHPDAGSFAVAGNAGGFSNYAKDGTAHGAAHFNPRV